MLKVIDNQQDYELLCLLDKSIILIPIYNDTDVHAKLNSVSLLFIRVDNKDDYLICIDHIESLYNIPLNNINNLLINDSKEIFILDKKKYLYYIDNVTYEQSCKFIDIGLIYYSKTNQPLPHIDYTHTYNKLYNYLPQTNYLISIAIHYEYVISIINKIDIINYDTWIIDYNNEAIYNLYKIESNGISTNINTLLSYIPTYKKTNYYEGLTFSEYGLYTSTGRPSNNHSKLNYAALSKSSGIRKCFETRFGEDGILMELDFSAYHLLLISILIGFDFKGLKLHEYLGRHYFKKINKPLTHEEYDKSKQITFNIIYGNRLGDYNDIDFFRHINEYIDKLFVEFNTIGYIISPIYNKKIYKKNFNVLTKNIIFNYFMQLLETEFSIKLIHKINKLKSNYNSSLILYTYDSFLFDININDIDYINQIKEVFNDTTFNYTVKIGNNYNEIEQI